MNDNDIKPLTITGLKTNFDPSEAYFTLDVDNTAYFCEVISSTSSLGTWKVDIRTSTVFAGPRVSSEDLGSAVRLHYGPHFLEVRAKRGDAVVATELPRLVIRYGQGQLRLKNPVFVVGAWVPVVVQGPEITDTTGLWVGDGLPPIIPGSLPGQGYLDQLTGNIYVLTEGATGV